MAEQASVAEDPTLTKASSATTAEFTLSADAFAFAALFRRVPEASVECKPVVATPTDRAIVVIDADADDEQIHNALEDDPVLGAIESFDKRSGRWTYQVTWTGQPRELFAKLRSASVTVLSAQATNGSWTFRILVFERTHINRAEHVLTDLDRQADWSRRKVL